MFVASPSWANLLRDLLQCVCVSPALGFFSDVKKTEAAKVPASRRDLWRARSSFPGARRGAAAYAPSKQEAELLDRAFAGTNLGTKLSETTRELRPTQRP